MTDSDSKNEECIKMFCKTVAELNAVSLTQMEGLLNIAATAAEKLKSGDTGDAAQFVSEIKTIVGEIGERAKNQDEEIYENVKAAFAADPEHSFCAAVEGRLLLAMDNSLALQQQLNVTGEAILTKAASLILSPAA